MMAVARVAAMTHRQLRQTFLHCLLAAWLTIKSEHHWKVQVIMLNCEIEDGVLPRLSICANLKFFLLKKSCVRHANHLNIVRIFDIETSVIAIVAVLAYITSSIKHPPARQTCMMQ